jgi:hypothetical protein
MKRDKTRRFKPLEEKEVQLTMEEIKDKENDYQKELEVILTMDDKIGQSIHSDKTVNEIFAFLDTYDALKGNLSRLKQNQKRRCI